MIRILTGITVALSLTAAAHSHAESPRFGRDSSYAAPGKSYKGPAPVVAAPINRSGRDSIYVTQTPNAHSTPPAADAKGPSPYGRDSTFAYGSPNPPAPGSSQTKVGSTGHRSGS